MPTLIYRITHYKNLDFILKNGIHCCNSNVQDPAYVSIGDTSLISSRGSKSVPVAPYGVLNDYVAFYFGVHSPMLLRIITGRVSGVTCTQSEIIYIVSSIEDIEGNGTPFVFTDGHAYQRFSSFYNDKKNLTKLDYKTIASKDWANTSLDNDKMRRKQAEFLVYNFVPTNCILGIGTLDHAALTEVKSILAKNGSNIPAKIKTFWYY